MKPSLLVLSLSLLVSLPLRAQDKAKGGPPEETPSGTQPAVPGERPAIPGHPGDRRERHEKRHERRRERRENRRERRHDNGVRDHGRGEGRGMGQGGEHRHGGGHRH